MSLSLSPPMYLQFFDPNNSGSPLAGGKLFTYSAGTTTKADTWVDITRTVKNANPIILDANGGCYVWIDPTLHYKFVLSPSNDTDPPSSPYRTVDEISSSVTIDTITQTFLGAILYPQTTAESAAGVTPVNYAYPEPDLRRRGITDFTGATDYTAQITQALLVASTTGSSGYIYHPGGTIGHASQVVWPNSCGVIGYNRRKCIFSFTGNPGGSPAYTRSGWRNVNGPNSSGFANIFARGVTFNYVTSKIGAACVECNAGGYSYYDFEDCEFTGQAQYGLILDAVEICRVKNNRIANQGTASSVNVWVVNGADRVAGQSVGFTNVLTISDNQIAGSGGTGLVDDGGNAHTIQTNNFDGHSTQAQFCAVNSLLLGGNSFETNLQTGSANVLMTDVGLNAGTLGPNTNGTILSNTFAGNMVAGSCLVFSGASFHTGFTVVSNTFGSLFGRGAAIDVGKLGNSYCGQNQDTGSGGMTHYTNVTSTANGCTLLPPQNGSSVTVGINGPTYGDTRYQEFKKQGMVFSRQALTYSTSITIDCKQGNWFTISVTDNVAFTINAPTNPFDGQRIGLTIRMTAGGAMGAITWNAVFKMSAWTNPATTNSRSIEFEYDGANWVQISQTGVDVPN